MHEHFGSSVAVSMGLANLMVFKTEASSMLHLVKSNDNLNIAVDKVAKQIYQEAQTYKQKCTIYNLNIDKDLAQEPVSETLLSILEKVSPKFLNSLSGLLIGNIVTSIVTVNSQPYEEK